MKKQIILSTIIILIVCATLLLLPACNKTNDNGYSNNENGTNDRGYGNNENGTNDRGYGNNDNKTNNNGYDNNDNKTSNIAITSISLNRSSITLNVGDSLSLYATIIPSNASNKSITWSSSDSAIATVSNGFVTAKASGSTTITARTNNNKTASCKITVKQLFEFEEYSNGYALVAYNGAENIVTVPSTYNGKNVTCIGVGKSNNYKYVKDAFSENTTIKKVILPNTVTGINHASFVNCSSLEEVIMPNVKAIGEYAFYNCTKLKRVALPATLENIYAYAFSNCESLENIEFPSNLKAIRDCAFSGCSSLSNVKFQNDNVEFSYSTFGRCNFKTQIKAPTTPYEFKNWASGISIVHTKATINNIEVRLIDFSSTSMNLEINIAGTKTYDYYGTSHQIKFGYKIKNGNTVLKSGTISSESVATGETFIAKSSSVYINIQPSKLNEMFDLKNNLTIEIQEIAW